MDTIRHMLNVLTIAVFGTSAIIMAIVVAILISMALVNNDTLALAVAVPLIGLCIFFFYIIGLMFD